LARAQQAPATDVWQGDEDTLAPVDRARIPADILAMTVLEAERELRAHWEDKRGPFRNRLRVAPVVHDEARRRVEHRNARIALAQEDAEREAAQRASRRTT